MLKILNMPRTNKKKCGMDALNFQYQLISDHLKYASARLKGGKEIVMTATNHNGQSFIFASNELQKKYL